ncbi:hypothetical protein RCL_jg15739.t1 [Rhizophagus clarus]|uniref:Uncharacterized protein n=1 Tax=Rhizophagus clarus TaxID=94130 RepID=A0A8H3MD52_9GLOM|nr:hypothetical protein RCL_jg15739.t1 [Rhizophagus clarus]
MLIGKSRRESKSIPKIPIVNWPRLLDLPADFIESFALRLGHFEELFYLQLLLAIPVLKSSCSSSSLAIWIEDESNSNPFYLGGSIITEKASIQVSCYFPNNNLKELVR